MLKKLLLSCVVLSSLIASVAFAGNVNVFAYASTSVTTSAYVTLWASTPASSSALEVCDTSTKLLKLAKGAAGSEVDFATVTVSGCVVLPVYLPAGTRISIKAIDATASSGYNAVSIL